jgi:predicted protein tyrosine phosphatase
MKFWVRNRKEVEDSNPLMTKHIIISIYTPFDAPPKVKKNDFTQGVLQLAFDDLDNPGPSTIRAMGEVVLFNEQMADQIIEFVNSHKDGVNCIVCHCDAGVSRSAGTAAALSKYFNNDDSEYFSSSGMYSARRFSPNMRVYRILLNQLMNGGGEEQVSSSGS